MGVRVSAFIAVELAVFAALLFGAAGTIFWPAAWVYLILFFGGVIGLTTWLARADPALLDERMKSPVQKSQPLWDKILLPLMIVVWCGWFVLMGLDAVRFRWSPLMPVPVQCMGAVMLLVSFWMFARVYRENTFLAPVVKIQDERHHHVISSGPYAIVRHPLYATMIVYLPGNALLLGSWWGLAGGLLLFGCIVIRTALEDRKLQRELPGYVEYASRVRYRLIPYVW